MYVDVHQKYIGDAVSTEIGFAIGKQKPVFIREEPGELLEIHPDMMTYVKIASPSQAIKYMIDENYKIITLPAEAP